MPAGVPPAAPARWAAQASDHGSRLGIGRGLGLLDRGGIAATLAHRGQQHLRHVDDLDVLADPFGLFSPTGRTVLADPFGLFEVRPPDIITRQKEQPMAMRGAGPALRR